MRHESPRVNLACGHFMWSRLSKPTSSPLDSIELLSTSLARGFLNV